MGTKPWSPAEQDQIIAELRESMEAHYQACLAERWDLCVKSIAVGLTEPEANRLRALNRDLTPEGG